MIFGKYPPFRSAWLHLYALHISLSLFLLLLCSILLPKTIFSQTTSTLNMLVEPAFEGVVKNGEWLPVWVEVSNQGESVSAEVQVRVESRNGATTYAALLSLPTNSRKRLPIYVQPNPYSRKLRVRLIDRSSNEMPQLLMEEEIEVESIENRALLIGLLTSERGALTDIQETDLRDNGRIRSATLIDLSQEQMPPNSAALRSFDVLIVNDVDTSSLSSEQGLALERWVRAGGHLILGGGAGAERVFGGLPPAVQPLLDGKPIELIKVDGLVAYASESKNVSDVVDTIKVSGPFLIQPASFPDGRDLIGDEPPLLIERAIGAGSVVYAALSLTDSPFNAWAGNSAFWQALLDNYVDYPAHLPDDISAQQQISSQMSYALSQLPALDLPSIRWLGILLILYILMVGPINYLLLRRLGRLHWAWGTIPLLTLTFSAAAFGLGYSLRGTDLILNHIAVVKPSSDGTGQVVNYMGLFSPSEQAYEIEIESDSLMMPMAQMDNRFGPMGDGPIEVGGEMTIFNGRPGRIRGLTVNQWAMQPFQTENQWPELGVLAGDFQIDGTKLIGAVENGLGITLEDVVVIFGNHFDRLGDMATGSTDAVSIDLAQQDQGQFGTYIWWEVFNNDPDVGPPNREAELKRQIAEAIFQNQMNAMPNVHSTVRQDVILIGWTSESPVEVRVAGQEPLRQTKSLIYSQIPLTLPTSGRVTVPSSLMTASLSSEPSNGGTCDRPNTLHMNSGSAVIDFVLPAEYQFRRIDELNLQAGYQYGDGEIPVNVAFYQWTNEEWIDADNDGSALFTTDSDLAALVSKNGEIRVQVSATRTFDTCGYFDLNISGEL